MLHSTEALSIGTVMAASSMYAGQVNAVMGYTSAALGIYAFADAFPQHQRYFLRWVAALVILFGLSWAAKATWDFRLIMRAIQDTSQGQVQAVYDTAELWPIAMYLYGAITGIVFVMILLRKLLQVHKWLVYAGLRQPEPEPIREQRLLREHHHGESRDDTAEMIAAEEDRVEVLVGTS